jgi:hypothetical protein
MEGMVSVIKSDSDEEGTMQAQLVEERKLSHFLLCYLSEPEPQQVHSVTTSSH